MMRNYSLDLVFFFQNTLQNSSLKVDELYNINIIQIQQNSTQIQT